MGYGPPLSGFSVDTATDTFLPPYDSFPPIKLPATAAEAAMKSDSGITYNLPLPRKRFRDQSTINRLSSPSSPHSYKNCGSSFFFLGEDLSFHFQQNQFDLDQLISQHMEKVRMEVEEKRKREGKRILETIEMGMMKILRNKEEEILNIGKLNWELEERVNSLCMENQIWRDVAQTNEATAIALRTNLEQLLSRVENDATALADDGESCCGSNNGGGDGWRDLEDQEGDSNSRGRKMMKKNDGNGGGGGDRRCKNCWKEECCVLLLPCRHLCLCTVCGSSLQTCPICNSTNNASVRVIMP